MVVEDLIREGKGKGKGKESGENCVYVKLEACICISILLSKKRLVEQPGNRHEKHDQPALKPYFLQIVPAVSSGPPLNWKVPQFQSSLLSKPPPCLILFLLPLLLTHIDHFAVALSEPHMI